MDIDADPTLLDRSMRWMDAYFDPEASLLWYPAETGRRHMVRESLWYALGLLLEGDDARADRCRQVVRTVLSLQYASPGAIWHGTWPRAPEDALPPPSDAIIWRDYDPNWRQFIGTILEIMPRLDERGWLVDLTSDMRRAVGIAIDSEDPDRVTAGYTNIALMKAWLEIEAASSTRREAGEALADAVHRRFMELGAFPEYNSPTYYGINLYALGLWRKASPALKDRGAAMLDILWSDIARYYHAGMKNLCGPWSRAYGMDMNRYVAALGLWIWAATDREVAPVPPESGDMDHAHDFCLGPLACLSVTALPAVARAELARFSNDRVVEQLISHKPSRTARAHLSRNLMVGVESSSVSFHGTGQYHPLTVHWLHEGEVRWLRLRFAGRIEGTAREDGFDIELFPDAETSKVVIEFAPDSLVNADDGRWQLAGAVVAVRSTLGAPKNETDRLAWSVKHGASLTLATAFTLE